MVFTSVNSWNQPSDCCYDSLDPLSSISGTWTACYTCSLTQIHPSPSVSVDWYPLEPLKSGAYCALVLCIHTTDVPLSFKLLNLAEFPGRKPLDRLLASCETDGFPLDFRGPTTTRPLTLIIHTRKGTHTYTICGVMIWFRSDLICYRFKNIFDLLNKIELLCFHFRCRSLIRLRVIQIVHFEEMPNRHFHIFCFNDYL